MRGVFLPSLIWEIGFFIQRSFFYNLEQHWAEEVKTLLEFNFLGQLLNLCQ